MLRGGRGTVYTRGGNNFDGTLLNFCDANCPNTFKLSGIAMDMKEQHQLTVIQVGTVGQVY